MSQTYRKDNYFLSLHTPRPAIIVRAPTAKNAARRPNDNQSFQKKLTKSAKNAHPDTDILSAFRAFAPPRPRALSAFSPGGRDFANSRSENATKRRARRSEKTLNDKSLKLHTL